MSDRTGDREGDLPDADSGETFSDVDSLKERLSEGSSGTEMADHNSGGGEEGDPNERDSGGTGGSEDRTQDDSGTVRMTFHVDRETAERLRNAVYWTATPVTLSGTARDALKAAVRQLEEEYNGGDAFPNRNNELKGGNPNLKG